MLCLHIYLNSIPCSHSLFKTLHTPQAHACRQNKKILQKDEEGLRLLRLTRQTGAQSWSIVLEMRQETLRLKSQQGESWSGVRWQTVHTVHCTGCSRGRGGGWPGTLHSNFFLNWHQRWLEAATAMCSLTGPLSSEPGKLHGWFQAALGVHCSPTEIQK